MVCENTLNKYLLCRPRVSMAQRRISMARKQTHKMEKLARIYDSEILPVWSHRFGRMLLRDLHIAEGSQILDVACGTGYPTTEIVRRLSNGSRLIAIDGSSAMLDIARNKVEEMGGKNVFFRTESAVPKLSFADDVYDIVVCNLGLGEFAKPEAALIDFARVTRPGGEVRCTLPLLGSYQEFYDIYREVLTKHDKHDALARLQDHLATCLWDVDQCYDWMATAGLQDANVEIEEFTMLFRSSREFFFAPVIEYGLLPEWKQLAGKGQEMQDIFWYIKEAIDAYYAGRAFEITIKAALIRGRVPLEVSVDDTVDTNAETTETSSAVDTGADTGEMSENSVSRALLSIDDNAKLDAFVDGSPRPPHLDEHGK